MAGAENPEVEVVEHEFTSRAPLTATPRQTTPVMIRAQFIPDYDLNMPLVGSVRKRSRPRLSLGAIGTRRSAGHRRRFEDLSNNVVR